MILAETYVDLMTDPAHIWFELTLEAISGLIVYPLIRFAHQRLTVSLHATLDAEHGFTHTDSPPSAPVPVQSNVRLLSAHEARVHRGTNA